MITINELVDMIAGSFFGGSMTTAGLVIYVLVMGLVFAFTKNVFQTLIIAIPITFMFSGPMLGLLPTDLVLILCVVLVLGLAMTSKKALTK